MKNNDTFWYKQVMRLGIICVSAFSVGLGIYFFFGFAITELIFMLYDAIIELKSRLNK